jgi:hypothetical protein
VAEVVERIQGEVSAHVELVSYFWGARTDVRDLGFSGKYSVGEL